jgi:3-oxoacyl-ACP reductase-like protein
MVPQSLILWGRPQTFRRGSFMRGLSQRLGIAAVWGTLVMAGAVAGCSSMSSNHVDCNVVKLQQQAGRSDGEIASALGVSVSDVASCHGTEKSGNATSGGGPAPY